MFNKIKKEKGFLLITITYLATFLYMLPLRNQTYQDDWAYIQSVRNFLNTGVLKVSEWSSASLVFQIYWGSLFSKIFGYNIYILHLSVIVLLYFGVVAFYFLLKRLGIDKTKSILFTIILFSFPWVFQFSYTFLTDVPFMSLSVICLYFYTAALQENKNRFYFLGSLFASFAFLTRQLGLAFPVSIFLILIILDISQRKIKLERYLYALLPFAVLPAIYFFWLKNGQNLTNAQYQTSYYFSDHVLPYLSPFNINKIGGTWTYYLSFIQRIVLYFSISIGFLLPVFLVFKPNLKSIKKFLVHYKLFTIFTSLTYLILLTFEFLQHYSRKAFIIEIPTLVTKNNIFPILDFKTLWPWMVVISTIIWIPIVASIFQTLFSSFIAKAKNKPKLFKRLIIFGSLFLLYYLFLIFQYNFNSDHPHVPYHDIFIKMNQFLSYINSPLEFTAFQNSLVILFVFSFVIFLLSLFLSFFKLNLKPRIKKPELGFIFFSFLGIFTILVIYMYFYWHQYVISIIPFFIIALAVVSKNWKIENSRAFIICIVLILFSTTLTKNRYENGGIIWEISNKIVESGIKPIDLGGTDESWLPWWYFEKTREEAVANEFNGNKYLITPGQWETWKMIKPESDYRYDIKKVSPDYKQPQASGTKVLLDETIHFSLFTKARFIVTSVKLK